MADVLPPCADVALVFARRRKWRTTGALRMTKEAIAIARANKCVKQSWDICYS